MCPSKDPIRRVHVTLCARVYMEPAREWLMEFAVIHLVVWRAGKYIKSASFLSPQLVDMYLTDCVGLWYLSDLRCRSNISRGNYTCKSSRRASVQCILFTLLARADQQNRNEILFRSFILLSFRSLAFQLYMQYTRLTNYIIIYKLLYIYIGWRCCRGHSEYS